MVRRTSFDFKSQFRLSEGKSDYVQRELDIRFPFDLSYIRISESAPLVINIGGPIKVVT